MLVKTEGLFFKIINIENSDLNSRIELSHLINYKKLKKNQNLILNFEKVKFIHSSVLPEFIECKKMAEKFDIAIVFVTNNKNLTSLFESSGISSVFKVCHTLTEAMEELDLVANY